MLNRANQTNARSLTEGGVIVTDFDHRVVVHQELLKDFVKPGDSIPAIFNLTRLQIKITKETKRNETKQTVTQNGQKRPNINKQRSKTVETNEVDYAIRQIWMNLELGLAIGQNRPIS